MLVRCAAFCYSTLINPLLWLASPHLSPSPSQMASHNQMTDSECQPSSPLLRKDPENGLPSRTSWRDFLRSEVDPDHATGPLAVFCFMTGFMCIHLPSSWLSERAVSHILLFQRCNLVHRDLRMVRIPNGQFCTGEAVFILLY